MDDDRAGLREVIRVLLLVQAAILIGATIEAVVWSAVFPGGPRSTVVLSGAAALSALVARRHLDRRWSRRLVYVVEGLIVVTFGLDALLALLITQHAPPLVAVLSGFALPLAIVALLLRAGPASVTVKGVA